MDVFLENEEGKNAFLFAGSILEITKLIYEYMLKKGKNTKEILNFKDKRGKSMLLNEYIKEPVLKWLVSHKELDFAVYDSMEDGEDNAFHVYSDDLGKLKLVAESPHLSESLRKKMLSHKNERGETPIEKAQQAGDEKAAKVRFYLSLSFVLSRGVAPSQAHINFDFNLHTVHARFALMSNSGEGKDRWALFNSNLFFDLFVFIF